MKEKETRLRISIGVGKTTAYCIGVSWVWVWCEFLAPVATPYPMSQCHCLHILLCIMVAIDNP